MGTDELTASLCDALEDGDLDLAGSLLRTGADPHGVHPFVGSTCLHAAWVGSGIEGVRLLVEYGADPSPLLLEVALNDAPDDLTKLINAGADPDFADAAGWTALHRVAAYGYTAVARALLAAGANRDARTSTGLTAAELARTNHHIDLSELLG